MIRFAVPRQLRKPALAVLALAGLVAWGGTAPSSVVRGAPSADAILAMEALGTAALVTGAPQVGALAESTDRPRSRTDAGGGARAPRARTEALRLPLGQPSRTPDAALSTLLAQSRAGRETAPSTGPPSLPF